MASTEPSKQTNVRLPIAYHEQLQVQADREGKAPGTLAKEMLIAMLDGGGGGQSPPTPHDIDVLHDRLDTIENRIQRFEETMHLTLRGLVRVLIVDPDEWQRATRSIDVTLGPPPMPKRG